MADTFQGVQWELRDATSGEELSKGFLHLHPHWEFPSEQQDCITLLQLHFPQTQPVWYGVWMVRLLSIPQVMALQTAFKNSEELQSIYGAKEFIIALAGGISVRQELRVQLLPLGHTDLGFYTIFAHCPRYKYAGDFPRWNPEALSQELMDCKVCGYSFIPVKTYSSEWKLGQATCDNCSFKIQGKELSDNDYRILSKWQTYQLFQHLAERDNTDSFDDDIRRLETEIDERYVFCPSCAIGYLFLKNSF